MADAMLSMAAERLFGLIEEQDQYNVNLVKGDEKAVLRLANDLQNIRNVMDDAENRRFTDPNINRWLSKLEQTASELDYILDEWNYAIRKQQISDIVAPPNQKVCFFIPSSSCLGFKKKVVLRDNIAQKLLYVIAQIDEILKEKGRFGFEISKPTVDPTPESLQVKSTHFIDLEEVHGRDMDRDILINKLMDNSCSSQEEFGVRVISILGMGGLGKTTLAQLVYNHSLIEEYFELRRWVCVSDPFDLVAICRGILGSSSPNAEYLDVLFRMVKESIRGKRFLLVLDDVWTEDYREWKSLEDILRCGGEGSRVLVTTRSRRVALMMGSRDSEIYQLSVLSNEDCWFILRRMALSGRKIEVEFEDIGKKIAQKCKGLPLAAKTLGRLLYFKSSLEEWENVLRGEIWDMEEAQVDIFPHLFLSYKDLSPTLKRCFSYCAVFPKDTKIIVENLVENWMALGYLGSDVGNMELKGRECFNVLAMHSLFQDFEKDDMDEIQSCKMHDILHDFAQFLKKSGRVEGAGRTESTTCQICDPLQVSNANVFSTLYWDEKTPPIFCECLGPLRVLSLTNCGLQSIPQGMEHLNHLRCLKLTGITKISHEDLKIIFRIYDLQTLSLEKCNLEVIPKEIGNLVRLRRLNLSCNESLKELPREIGNLIQLRNLNLGRNKSLKELPREIGKLIDLTNLDLSWNESLKDLPGEIWNLIHLRLLCLTGNKHLEELPRDIENLVHMRRLDLGWNVFLKKLPNEIGNLVFLRHFNLMGNKSLEELPESIGDLQELQTLNILGCKRICRLPKGVAKLIGLRTLNEFRGGSGGNKFALLKNLNNLGGVLWLRIKLEGDFDLAVVDDARAAELINKTGIEEFRIYFEEEEEEEESSSVSLDVVDVLEPHSMLRELSIWNYGGSELPKWILFSQVRNLSLHFCKHLTSLPPFGKLPCLEELCIDAMEALKTVGREFLGITTGGEGVDGGDVIAFPKLKTLEFRDCVQWKVWEDITEEESAASGVMPCLTELTITGCIGLTLLPHRLLRKASSLNKLRISGSTELVRRYGNEDDSIPINNPHLRLICYS